MGDTTEKRLRCRLLASHEMRSGSIITLIGMPNLLISVFWLTLVFRFVDRDMLLRYHWGLGVGHTYSHIPSSTDESRSAETLSPASIPVSSQFQTCAGTAVTLLPVDDHDPVEEFVLPQWDGSDLEWEVIDSDSDSDSDSTSEEGADIETMYALYDDAEDSDY